MSEESYIYEKNRRRSLWRQSSDRELSHNETRQSTNRFRMMTIPSLSGDEDSAEMTLTISITLMLKTLLETYGV